MQIVRAPDACISGSSFNWKSYQLDAYFPDSLHSFSHVMKLIILISWIRRKTLKEE